MDYANLYLIKIESSENKRHPWSGKNLKEAEQIFSQTYPAIYQHLNGFREKLIKRDDQGKYFWELRSCKYWEDFNQHQIVWGNLATEPKFALAPPGYYLSAPAVMMVTNSMYLLGILNSKITQYLVSQSAAERQGGFLEYKPMYISPLAIPDRPTDEKISILVNQILEAKQTNPEAEINSLEKELDNAVYQLFEMTEEEIAIVEGTVG
jgi:hypothetical protein